MSSPAANPWWEHFSADEEDSLFSPRIPLTRDREDEIEAEILRSSMVPSTVRHVSWSDARALVPAKRLIER